MLSRPVLLLSVLSLASSGCHLLARRQSTTDEQYRATVAAHEQIQARQREEGVQARAAMYQRQWERDHPGPAKRKQALAKIDARGGCSAPEEHAQCSREVVAEALQVWSKGGDGGDMNGLIHSSERPPWTRDAVAQVIPADTETISDACRKEVEASEQAVFCTVETLVQHLDAWLARRRPNLFDEVLEAARADHQRRVHESGADLVWLACSALARRQDAEQAIADDKRAAKHSGVPDYGLRQRMGRQIVEANDEITDARTRHLSRLGRALDLDAHCR